MYGARWLRLLVSRWVRALLVWCNRNDTTRGQAKTFRNEAICHLRHALELSAYFNPSRITSMPAYNSSALGLIGFYGWIRDGPWELNRYLTLRSKHAANTKMGGGKTKYGTWQLHLKDGSIHIRQLPVNTGLHHNMKHAPTPIASPAGKRTCRYDLVQTDEACHLKGR